MLNRIFFAVNMPNPIVFHSSKAFPGKIATVALFVLCFLCASASAQPQPVRVGLDAEFGLDNSTSAQAVELGMRTAIAEINRAGGVLKGRPIELVTKDHRSIPARGIRNIEEFARMPDLVAVFLHCYCLCPV